MTFSELHQLQPEHILKFITQLQEQLIQQKELIETLEAEIRRLKNLPAKPDIKPGRSHLALTFSVWLIIQHTKVPK